MVIYLSLTTATLVVGIDILSVVALLGDWGRVLCRVMVLVDKIHTFMFIIIHRPSFIGAVLSATLVTASILK